MGEPQSDGLPTADERGYYQLYRQRIDREDDLVHQRVTWLLTAQGLLFSVWAVGLRGAAAVSAGHAPVVVLAVIGIVVAAVAFLGLWAALRSIGELKEQYDRHAPASRPDHPLPPIVSSRRDDLLGTLVPLALPPVALAGWVAVLLATFAG